MEPPPDVRFHAEVPLVTIRGLVHIFVTAATFVFWWNWVLELL